MSSNEQPGNDILAITPGVTFAYTAWATGRVDAQLVMSGGATLDLDRSAAVRLYHALAAALSLPGPGKELP